MPKYDYTCPNCDLEVELTHSIHDDSPRDCRVCGYHMIRTIALPAVTFKGSGFYSTDNPKR